VTPAMPGVTRATLIYHPAVDAVTAAIDIYSPAVDALCSAYENYNPALDGNNAVFATFHPAVDAFINELYNSRPAVATISPAPRPADHPNCGPRHLRTIRSLTKGGSTDTARSRMSSLQS
jgi:hypothetical protein